MAITLQGSNSSITANGATDNLTLPGTPVEDDIIVFCCAGDRTNSNTVRESGYNVLQNVSGTASTPQFDLEWKRMGATPDTTINVVNDMSGSASTANCIQTWSGVDTSTAIDATVTTASGGPGDPDPPSFTTVTADAMRIAAGALDDDIITDYAAPSGWGDLIEQDTTGAPAGQGGVAMMASLAAPSTGALDPAAFVGSGSDDWESAHFALRPAVGNTVTAAATLAFSALAQRATTLNRNATAAFSALAQRATTLNRSTALDWTAKVGRAATLERLANYSWGAATVISSGIGIAVNAAYSFSSNLARQGGLLKNAALDWTAKTGRAATLAQRLANYSWGAAVVVGGSLSIGVNAAYSFAAKTVRQGGLSRNAVYSWAAKTQRAATLAFSSAYSWAASAAASAGGIGIAVVASLGWGAKTQRGASLQIPAVLKWRGAVTTFFAYLKSVMTGHAGLGISLQMKSRWQRRRSNWKRRP